MRTAPRLTVAFGAAAFMTATALFIIGAAVYGHEMGPAIIASVAGIFAEAALVVLLLDRIARVQEARDWAFVRHTVGQRMAAAMVE